MKIKAVSLLATLVMLLAIVFSVSTASAIPFDAIYTVASNGSTTLKNVFTLNDPAPWLYLDLPQTGQNVTWSWWTDPASSSSFAGTGLNNDADGKMWLSLSNWDSIKELGMWTIEANTSVPPCCANEFEGITNFTVVQAVPEPSIAVFLLAGGAGLLGLSRSRNKNR